MSQAICERATQLARWLSRHRAVRRVYYPGLETHPGHVLAARQQSAGGGIVAFDVHGGRAEAWGVIDATRVLSITANLGDVKTTIVHPASTTHGRITPEQREAAGIGESLIRVAVGLDAFEDIRADQFDLETLMAFADTTDHDRQRAVWERVSAQGYRPAAWQVKRMLTEERVPADAPTARFVGVGDYEAAGGPVRRDLFADEHENGVWLEDPKLLDGLAIRKLQAAADELVFSARWNWAEAMADVDWSATARSALFESVNNCGPTTPPARLWREGLSHDRSKAQT